MVALPEEFEHQYADEDNIVAEREFTKWAAEHKIGWTDHDKKMWAAGFISGGRYLLGPMISAGPDTPASWFLASDIEKDPDTGEPLYWSQTMGWVTAEYCDAYSTDDKQFIPLLENSHWVICPHDG